MNQVSAFGSYYLSLSVNCVSHKCILVCYTSVEYYLLALNFNNN